MNTVTWGPEASPRTPHSPHSFLSSMLDHQVERGTKVVTRAARRRDWEALSGRRQFSSKDTLSTIKEDPLFCKRSIRASNPRMQSRTFGSDIESLRPGTEVGVEGREGHIQPSGADSVHLNPAKRTVFTVSAPTNKPNTPSSSPPIRILSGIL